ncbi:sensor histidine kinase [Lactobacillus agrestimuris]|uniref:sensor histidine kinase n=1 Tax=Lactobacillus agrestimuris TaxID=2941328 RepID=UPI002043BF9C|nr:HAMP domain-containing sensor histidine kinase [Lactobacillus agrestimuris]
MKLIYQHMLSFFLIIITTVFIIGYSELDTVRNQAYSQNFQRMDSYAKAIGEMAKSTSNGGNMVLSDEFLNQLQFVLKRDNVQFGIFNQDNEQVYPKVISGEVKLSNNVFNTLKKGHEIQIRNNNSSSEQQVIGKTKSDYTGVLVPWMNGSKLIGVIWIGSTVKDVERPIMMAKQNLFNALIVTLLVGLILSLILSYYSTNKIKKLSNAADKVAAGNFDVQIPHKNKDEIDQLAANFNRMVRELKKSNDEVKAQEERRDQFMADAAHEMRTPLTTINGIIEGLQYDAIPEESKPKSYDLMGRETKRLIRLVNENLDYEKIRSNQISLVKTQFDAVRVLKDLDTQLTPNAQKVNDQLIFDIPASLSIYADRDRFTQIMVNLIQNAIQFTRDGKIIVSAKREPHAAILSVKDNGIGMNKKQEKYIFERFFKADPSRARMGTGESGLGLSIVSSLIKQHGGKIEVESEERKGSTFTVTIYDKGYEKFVE